MRGKADGDRGRSRPQLAQRLDFIFDVAGPAARPTPRAFEGEQPGILVRAGKFAAAAVTEQLKDEKVSWVRVKLVEALWNIEKPSVQTLLPTLLEALKDGKSEVARRLGIGRSTLYRKVREQGLDGMLDEAV